MNQEEQDRCEQVKDAFIAIDHILNLTRIDGDYPVRSMVWTVLLIDMLDKGTITVQKAHEMVTVAKKSARRRHERPPRVEAIANPPM
jgi:hypothetical protein